MAIDYEPVVCIQMGKKIRILYFYSATIILSCYFVRERFQEKLGNVFEETSAGYNKLTIAAQIEVKAIKTATRGPANSTIKPSSSFRRPQLRNKLYSRNWSDASLFSDWMQAGRDLCTSPSSSSVKNGTFCNLYPGSLTSYPGFIHMRNVFVDPSRFSKNDPECKQGRLESWGLIPGFFHVRLCSLHCTKQIQFH